MVALEPARVKGILYLVLTISDGYTELHPQEITLTFLVNRMHLRYLPPSQRGTGLSDFPLKHLELCTVRRPQCRRRSRETGSPNDAEARF